MVLYWLFLAVAILSLIDLILLTYILFKIFKEILPNLQENRFNQTDLNQKDQEWFDLMEQWLNDAYQTYPDSKQGLLMVRKQLRKQKEE